MRWQEGRKSENVEDRRGTRATRGGPMVLGGGIGGLVILIIVVLAGGDPRALLQNMGQPQQAQAPDGGMEEASGGDDEGKEFVSRVLGTTEDVWEAIFRQSRREYHKPILVLFRGEVDSACGFASAAAGPFYCPPDEKVYIDLAFYDELRQRFGAPGDFAQAYVIAHEIGHHVQKLVGTSDKVHALKGRVSEADYNYASVCLELQADYFAGVWAHHAKRMNLLEPGDIDEAINAASAIGDDKIQMQSRGYVVPESFTHGSSDQRRRWFRKGFDSGDWNGGDTFNAERL